MTTGTPIADAALLTLLRLASPALPVGGFSYSEGLEASVDHGLVASEKEAVEHLIDLLHLGMARGELPALGLALDAWRQQRYAQALAINTWLLASRESAELSLQAQQMGRSLLEWLRGVEPAHALIWDEAAADDQASSGALPTPSFACAFALAAAGSPADTRAVLTAYAFAWCENLMQAAIKSIPLGQSAGQRILASLCAQIPIAVGDALSRVAAHPAHADALAVLQAYCPGQAILSARHETQYSRLFRS